MDGAFETPAHIEESPAVPAGHILHFHPAQCCEQGDDIVQDHLRFAALAPARRAAMERLVELVEDPPRVRGEAVADLFRKSVQAV